MSGTSKQILELSCLDSHVSNFGLVILILSVFLMLKMVKENINPTSGADLVLQWVKLPPATWHLMSAC